MFARAYKKFQPGRHAEIYLPTLKEQDKTTIELSLNMVNTAASSCLTKEGEKSNLQFTPPRISNVMPKVEPQMPQQIVVEEHPHVPVEENNFLPGQDQYNLEVISLYFTSSITLFSILC